MSGTELKKGTEAEKEAIIGQFWKICGPFRVGIVLDSV